MSKMAELAYDIQELYIEGFNSRAIAEELNCPIEIVLGALKEMNVADSTEDFSPFDTVNS
jgi:orotate phosphoribosyltransferase-like protein